MFNKVYEYIKKIIKENYLFISFCFLLPCIMLYPLPYYIYSGGGISNVKDKIIVEDGYEAKGSFNLCYVSEIDATISSYVIAKFIPGWEIVSKNDVSLNEKESMSDIFKRDKILLDTTNVNAIKVAYSKAGKDFKIKNTNNYIIYLTEGAITDLEIGDNIILVDGKTINNIDDLGNIINQKQVDDIINFTVIRNNKEINCTAKVRMEKERKLVGIGLETSYNYETNPPIDINFGEREAGPSGGLITTLEIYNNLVKEDITKGLKIAGTGTIDENGNVGPISGIKYKLKGAVKGKADIFIVPNTINYEEAIKEKEKHNYDIEIIGVDTFDETIEYLKKK